MIYLDNAATTWPKPYRVNEAVTKCMKYYAANPGRGGHKMAIKAEELVYECRENISELFKIDNPGNVIFTMNCTHALNIIINGLLESGDHVIYTCMDHNSVLRPIYSLKENVESSMALADKNGFVKPETIKSLIRPETKLIVMTHVSNVCGTIQSVKDVSAIAKENNILFLLDAAQSAGVIDINMSEYGIDYLACSGHKSLYGPMGMGVLCVNSDISVRPLIYGGTGSYSRHLTQPDELPDRLESGTLNLPGICGLNEGINYINNIGTKNIFEHEMSLTSFLLKGLEELKGYKVIGNKNSESRTGVVSFIHETKCSVEIAEYLNKSFNIASRASYHCAYKAHEALGTNDSGTVRVSIGAFNTLKDIKTLLYALKAM